MYMVKPYYIFSRKIWTFHREASLPFLGGNGLLGCGITFDIFTHGKPQVFFLFTLFTCRM